MSILLLAPVLGDGLPPGSGAIVSRNPNYTAHITSGSGTWFSIGAYVYSDGAFQLFRNEYAENPPEAGGGFALVAQVIVYDSSWYFPKETAIGAGYWVRATRVSGSWREDVYPFDSWLQLNVLKAFETEKALYDSGTEPPPLDTLLDVELKLEFSTSGTGTPIVATWNCTAKLTGFYSGG